MNSNLGRKLENKAVQNANLRQIVKRIDDLPVVPAVAIQALKLSLQDDVDLKKLGQVVETDAVLTAKILKLVNKASMGLSQKKVISVQQAINLIGLNALRSALLGVMIKEYLVGDDKIASKNYKELWAHNLLCAILAQEIAQKTFPELKNTSFVAGLLHDMGKSVIMDVFPEKYDQIKESQDKLKISQFEAEQKLLGTNHSLVGKILAKNWKLPEELIDCIWFHHQPIDSIQCLEAGKELIYIVIMADILAHEIFCDQSLSRDTAISLDRLKKILRLNDQEIEQIKLEGAKTYSEKAGLFSLDSDFYKIFHEIIQRANKKLSEMALEVEHKNVQLARTNKILQLAHNLSLNLTSVLTLQELFQGVVKAFQCFPDIQVGIIYIIDLDTRELEGQIWLDSHRTRNLLCFLDKEGMPVWEHDDQSIPEELKRAICMYKARSGSGVSKVCYDFCPPFHIFNFCTKKSLIGELCLVFKKGLNDLYSREKLIFNQVSNLISSTLERIFIYEKLEKRSEELSQALWRNQQINLQLLQTERLAAVGQLAAGAAHEINNPLAIISARAQLLQFKETDAKKKKELALITEQIERISRILSSLMDFARPSPPKLTDVNLHEILDKVLEFVSNGLKKHNISIIKNYDKNLPVIKADPAQLEQVFLNLCINAQHAMEKSGGNLTLVTEHSEDGQNVIIKIIDQGEGIPKENLNKIFDPFFTTKEEGKGTGLGLSTSFGIINNHFGTIRIDSEVGKGTTITIELPVNIESLRPVEQDILDAKLKTVGGVKPKVLVVDDEEHIRDILKETLEGENMLVDTADNGQEGLEKLLTEKYDLLLLDIRMPLRDGLSLLREIKKRDKSLPVIVITGMATHEEMEEALSHGSCKCIRKPFHIKTLLEEIHKSLTGE